MKISHFTESNSFVGVAAKKESREPPRAGTKAVILRAESKEGAPKPAAALNEKENNQFEACEDILRRGLGTFFEVGSALLTIRQERLYRVSHSTFESYCHERWGIGRSYAWRVIGAAERLKLLPENEDIPRPSNEFQIRPFLKLEPEQFPKAWQQALRKAKDGKVTQGIVREVLADIDPARTGPSAKDKRPARRKLASKFSLGKFLALLQEAKRKVERYQTDEALESLEKIEALVFGVAEM